MPRKAKKSKRFKYNLQTVLKVRGIREKQEKEKFNEAERKLREEEEKEHKLKAQLNGAYAELRDMMTKGDISQVNKIIMHKAYIENLKVKVEEQVKVREEAEKAKEEQRQKLIMAVKEKKIIEKDREHKREAWRKLMDKEEGKFLDDIATVRHVEKLRVRDEEESTQSQGE